jgi:hypothetical protein
MPLSARNKDPRHRHLQAMTGAPRHLVGRTKAGAIPLSMAVVVSLELDGRRRRAKLDATEAGTLLARNAGHLTASPGRWRTSASRPPLVWM